MLSQFQKSFIQQTLQYSMHIMEQRSPMLFDIDSPYMERLRKMPSTVKDSSDGMMFDLVQKSSDGLRSSLKVPSIRLQRIVNRKESEHLNEQQKVTSYQRSKMLKSQQKRRKVVFGRQHSQPLQISHPNKPATGVQSSSNNQNVRKRLTSLQKYFEQTRSIQLPFATKNRINQNQRFLSQIKQFQMNLSRAKSTLNNNQQSSPNTSRNNINSGGRQNRLSQTRPKPLKIHELQSENVKKEKNRIFVEKIMREKVKEYRDKMWDQEFIQKEKEIYRRPVALDSQIVELGHQVEKIQLQLKLLKRQSRQKQHKMKLITDYFAFLN